MDRHTLLQKQTRANLRRDKQARAEDKAIEAETALQKGQLKECCDDWH